MTHNFRDVSLTIYIIISFEDCTSIPKFKSLVKFLFDKCINGPLNARLKLYVHILTPRFSSLQLRTVIVGDHAMSTRLLLCQHAEQLESAIVLREMHAE